MWFPPLAPPISHPMSALEKEAASGWEQEEVGEERDAQLPPEVASPLSVPSLCSFYQPAPLWLRLTSLYTSTSQKQCPLWEQCWSPRAVTSFDKCQC